MCGYSEVFPYMYQGFPPIKTTNTNTPISRDNYSYQLLQYFVDRTQAGERREAMPWPLHRTPSSRKPQIHDRATNSGGISSICIKTIPLEANRQFHGDL